MEHKAIARIFTESGPMTIFYNGVDEEMTAENEDLTEEIGYSPKSLEDAIYVAAVMYCNVFWGLEWIED